MPGVDYGLFLQSHFSLHRIVLKASLAVVAPGYQGLDIRYQTTASCVTARKVLELHHVGSLDECGERFNEACIRDSHELGIMVLHRDRNVRVIVYPRQARNFGLNSTIGKVTLTA